MLGQDLTFAENEWQKRYYARQASLIIYESLNDLFDLLGKDFKTIINTKLNNSELESKFLLIRKELNQFKDNNFNRLKEIRNVATAHRDNDILKQINLIAEISWSEVIGIVTVFDKILNKLGPLLQELINYDLRKLDELRNKE